MAAMAFGGAAGLIGISQWHLCDQGQPLAQWVIPGATASAAMLFVGRRPLRRAIAFASVALALVLSVSFTTAVHGPTYTGNPRATRDRAAPHGEWHTIVTGLYRKP